jgi:hypothetical protein
MLSDDDVGFNVDNLSLIKSNLRVATIRQCVRINIGDLYFMGFYDRLDLHAPPGLRVDFLFLLPRSSIFIIGWRLAAIFTIKPFTLKQCRNQQDIELPQQQHQYYPASFATQ